MGTVTWVGGKHGLWSNKADWSGHLLPQITDDVLIGAGTTLDVNVAALADDLTPGATLSGGTLNVGLLGGGSEHFAVAGSANGANLVDMGGNAIVTFTGGIAAPPFG
jgi:hypothetical protein